MSAATAAERGRRRRASRCPRSTRRAPVPPSARSMPLVSGSTERSTWWPPDRTPPRGNRPHRRLPGAQQRPRRHLAVFYHRQVAGGGVHLERGNEGQGPGALRVHPDGGASHRSQTPLRRLPLPRSAAPGLWGPSRRHRPEPEPRLGLLRRRQDVLGADVPALSVAPTARSTPSPRSARLRRRQPRLGQPARLRLRPPPPPRAPRRPCRPARRTPATLWPPPGQRPPRRPPPRPLRLPPPRRAPPLPRDAGRRLSAAHGQVH